MLSLAIPCYHRLWIASLSGGLGVVGSNPAAPTKIMSSLRFFRPPSKGELGEQILSYERQLPWPERNFRAMRLATLAAPFVVLA